MSFQFLYYHKQKLIHCSYGFSDMSIEKYDQLDPCIQYQTPIIDISILI